MPYATLLRREQNMLSKLIDTEFQSERLTHKEGDLYKVITVYGKSFEIRYGYYGEEDRQNPGLEPYHIYPDFELNPEYTDDGIPFTVAWQGPCAHYKLAEGFRKHEDNGCFECKYYEKCEDLLGVCRCNSRKKAQPYKEGDLI